MSELARRVDRQHVEARNEFEGPDPSFVQRSCHASLALSRERLPDRQEFSEVFRGGK